MSGVTRSRAYNESGVNQRRRIYNYTRVHGPEPFDPKKAEALYRAFVEATERMRERGLLPQKLGVKANDHT